MSRILPVTEAKNEAAETLSAMRQQLGMVPNLYASVAHSPSVLNAFLVFNEALSLGRLTAKQRELIALAVGQANQCQYCLSAHTLLAGNAGIDKAQALAARQGQAEEALDQAIVTFAKQVVEQRGEISDEQFDAARQSGIDDELVIEILAQVTVNTFTNYSNHVVQTEIDFPLASLSV